MNTKMRLADDGKAAIIIGASSGIGAVIALEFASAGAKVVLTARRIERLEKLAETIRAAGGIALLVRSSAAVLFYSAVFFIFPTYFRDGVNNKSLSLRVGTPHFFQEFLNSRRL